MKQTLFLLLLVFAFSCSGGSELKEDLARLQSQKISISLDKMQHQIDGRDTLVSGFTNSELKMIIYSDSLACASCAIRGMYGWYDFIEKTKKYQGRLKYYFLFSPKKEQLKTVKRDLRGNMLNYPVFIDSEAVFAKENPHLPKRAMLHTFLLDENNKVILVGNPLENEKIKEIFYKVVEEKLGKK